MYIEAILYSAGSNRPVDEQTKIIINTAAIVSITQGFEDKFCNITLMTGALVSIHRSAKELCKLADIASVAARKRREK